MARIAGINIPLNKHIVVALTSIYGIGDSRARQICTAAGIDPTTGLSRLRVKNKFRVGDEMELLSPGGNRRFRLETMFDKQGRPLLEVPGGGWEVSVRLPEGAGEMALVTRFSP